MPSEPSQDRFDIRQLALGRRQGTSTIATPSCFSPASASNTQRSFFITRSTEGGRASPLSATTPRHAAQTNPYFGRNSGRGVTADGARKQFSTLTAPRKLGSTMGSDGKVRDSKRYSRRQKNSHEVEQTVAGCLRKMSNPKHIDESMSEMSASQMLATANIKSNLMPIYEENRDKSITTHKNISKLIDVTPRNPAEKILDIDTIITFNKAQTEVVKE